MGLLGPIGFSRGLVVSASTHASPKDSLYYLDGLRYKDGSLAEINGTNLFVSAVESAGSEIIGGIFVNPLTPDTYPFVALTNGKFFGVDEAGVPTDISGTAAIGNVGEIYSDILNGIMVIPGGAGGTLLRQWSGTGNVTTISSSPASMQIARMVNNYMFVAGDGSSDVRFSNVIDPTTWPAANIISFRDGDGDQVSCLSRIGDDLFIFKRRSIGRLNVSGISIGGLITPGPLTTVHVGIGCSGFGGADYLPDGRIVFWGSDAHAYLFDGTSLLDISDPQYPLSNVQTHFDEGAPSIIGGTGHVAYYPPLKEVWFMVNKNPIAGNDTDHFLAWNYLTQTWAHRNMSLPQTKYLIWLPTLNGVIGGLTPGGVHNDNGNMLAGSNGNTIYVHDVSASDTGYTETQWRTSVNFRAESRTFQPRSIVLIHRGASGTGNFTVSFAFDDGTFSTPVTVATSTSYVRSQLTINIPSTDFSTIQIKVIHTASGQTAAGLSFEPFYLSDEVMP